MAGNLGRTKTWKITYSPQESNFGIMGVAFVEADTRQWAICTFQQLYAGNTSLSPNVKSYSNNGIYGTRLICIIRATPSFSQQLINGDDLNCTNGAICGLSQT